MFTYSQRKAFLLRIICRYIFFSNVLFPLILKMYLFTQYIGLTDSDLTNVKSEDGYCYHQPASNFYLPRSKSTQRMSLYCKCNKQTASEAEMASANTGRFLLLLLESVSSTVVLFYLEPHSPPQKTFNKQETWSAVGNSVKQILIGQRVSESGKCGKYQRASVKNSGPRKKRGLVSIQSGMLKNFKAH